MREMTWEAARAKVAVLQAQADVDISAGGKKNTQKLQHSGEDKRWNMADADRVVFLNK